MFYCSNSQANNHCLIRDLRARLELCLDRLVEVCSTVDCRLVEEKKAGTEDEIPFDTEFLVRSPQVTALVRKELAVCIRDLIHHGLGQSRPGAGLLPFSGCMSGEDKYFIIERWKYFNTMYFQYKICSSI